MKIVFMGTPDFAVPALERLVEHHEVVCVVTKEDKERGRGRKVQFSEVKEVAVKHNLPIFQPKRIKSKDSIEFLKTLEADIFVVVAYGQILSKEILDMPKIACLNIHGSILPKYRGPAPIHWSIINGEKETGATIMYMDEGMDTGDIIKIAKLPIGEEDTLGKIYYEMCELGANTLIEVLADIENGTINRIKQNDDEATYAPMIEKEIGLIDFNKTAVEIKNLIRGLNPMPSAYFTHKGVKYKVHEAVVIESNDNESGKVISYDKNNGLVITTKENALSITKIQKQGGKAMDIKSFLNGNAEAFAVNEKIDEVI